MTLSPDGQWMWDGQAWIPAPPNTPENPPQILTMPSLQQPAVQPAGMYIQQNPQGAGGIIVLVIVVVLLIPVIAIVASGVLYVWANSLASDQPESGSLNNFAAEDASEFLSGATDDTMIRMSWTYADEDLNWAFLSFRLEKGDAVYNCEIAANSGGSDCLIEQTGDSDTLWESDEIVYIKENGFDICTSSCDLSITIQYNGQVLSGTNFVTIA